MTNEEIIRLLFSLLGGGIAVAILNWIRLNRTELRERKINFLDLQLEKLYGPLYYFVCQCEKLFELNKRWDDAYCKEYIGKEWSQDPNTQEAISKGASDIIELRNTYIAEVEKNSENIKEILNNNYAYIDQDDIDTFTLFYEHYIRRKIELDNEKKLKPPIRPYQDVGNISFLRPEFISRVKEKFIQKKEGLDKLSGCKMDLKIKKIIAREGLVLLAIIGISSCIFVFASFYPPYPKPAISREEEIKIRQEFVEKYGRPPKDLLVEKVDADRDKIRETGSKAFIFGYAIYLLLRFVRWAIKVLKQKSVVI